MSEALQEPLEFFAARNTGALSWFLPRKRDYHRTEKNGTRGCSLESKPYLQDNISKVSSFKQTTSSFQRPFHSVDSRLYPPPVHLGKGSRHQCPAVGESPPCHLQSSQITVGPLVFPDPKLDLPCPSVYHFLTHRALLSNQQHRLGFFL